MSFPGEASQVYDLSGRTPMNYLEWRQIKQFERSFRWGIDSAARHIAANNEQLADRNIRALGEVRSGLTLIEQSVEGVSEEIRNQTKDIRLLKDAVVEGANQVTSAIYWGFTETFALIGRTNDKLDDLLRLARTPSQTWALEQFENARDEYRRGLYVEALESVDRAINGFGGNPGYKTEFRFHMLLGTLRLGDNRNADRAVVDPALAETAFLSAARYAATDYPLEAGNALVWGGRACFVQRSFEKALQHTQGGVRLAPYHSIGHYQLARLLLIHRQRGQAVEHLARAVALNPELSISALSDHEFLDNRSALEEGLTEALHRLKLMYSVSFAALQDATALLKSLDMAEGDYNYVMRGSASKISTAVEDMEGEFSTGTIAGVGGALKIAAEAETLIQGAIKDYPHAVTAWIDECSDFFASKSLEAASAVGWAAERIKEEKVEAREAELQANRLALTAFWAVFLTGSLLGCTSGLGAPTAILGSALLGAMAWVGTKAHAGLAVSERLEQVQQMEQHAAEQRQEMTRLDHLSVSWRARKYVENERRLKAESLLQRLKFDSVRERTRQIACGGDSAGRGEPVAQRLISEHPGPSAAAAVERSVISSSADGNHQSQGRRNSLCSCGSGKKYKQCHGAFS